MEYVKIGGEFPKLKRSAVTLGKFDGIHKGHRKLIEKILEQKDQGAQSVVCAFEVSSQMLLSHKERAALLEKAGVDILMECPLDEQIRHMKAESFVKEILVGDLKAIYVAVGEDYRFGFERKGTPALLKALGERYGFAVDILSKEMDGHRKISSTYIREELKRGNMEKITSLLGYDFFLDGVVEHGRGLGHKVLFPTTNLIPASEKLMPPNGVYVTASELEGKLYEGITNVGFKPTVGGQFLGVETYLFHCKEDLYGEKCRVSFKKFLRPEKKFHSLELLRAQMEQDIINAKKYLQKETGR
ncbi:MAG TPA: bifunctional riboflavin kinase/FAD synthetase [Candidatus Blautia faecavium]|uniref:Riboflavin biosynthesis protein n=1 Tax=Candidatus Blautia faecavium TaxID=2838487 RepID=A0A9D2RWM0_9FIRM|nr:bifunctional riboflavin kinase/FAD synthetase [Candidatus Blautia faecavium]